MDKRRRRYVMHDVYFLDDPLGCAIYDTFGAAGVAIWMGFIAACKKNHIEGQMSYTSEAEALAVMGLPGLEMRRPGGEPFTLDDFWRLCADHKVTRRRQSGRRLHVISTRWTEWQVNPRKPKAGEQNTTSDGTNTAGMSDESGDETALETETERETEISSSEDERVSNVWAEIARRKLEHAKNVSNVKAWTAQVIRQDRSELLSEAVRYVTTYPTINVSQLAGVLMGEKQILRHLPRALEEAS